MTPKSPPNITVFDIANWFLAKAQGVEKHLKPMKLQKLVYFAYGWYFAHFENSLFPERIFAWRHGPVVADLYGRFKRFKGNPIECVTEIPKFDDNVTSVLNEVWRVYAPITDVRMSDITHRIDAPWAKVYSESRWGAEIEPTEIRDYFKTLKDKFDNDKS